MDNKPRFVPRSQRGRGEAAKQEQPAPLQRPALATSESAMPAEDRALITKKYLGIAPADARPASRKRFRFDWDESDDTQGASSRIHAPAPGTQKRRDPLLERDVHWSRKALGEMTPRDWRIFLEDYDIVVHGGAAPSPLRSWSEAGLPAALLQNLRRFEEPTPIQRQLISTMMCKRDCVGIAETGSGKTAAYLVPIIAFIDSLRLPDNPQEYRGPYAVILVPTRELAAQIDAEFQMLARGLKMRCTSIIGGHSIAEQTFRMRTGMEVIVATPGRLRDCLEQRIVGLDECQQVVLDEADRMIEMNYEADMAHILEAWTCTTSKRLALVSATMPAAVQRIVRQYLHAPLTIRIGDENRAASAKIAQEFRVLPPHEEHRMGELVRLLQSREDQKVIVFVNQKTTADALLRRIGSVYDARQIVSLHGGKSQEQRESAIGRFRSADVPFLIATDVVGRGIDVEDVALIINYDMPARVETYVHRIGRTGRAGATGKAVTFITEEDVAVLPDLLAFLSRSPQRVDTRPLEALLAASKTSKQQ